MAAGGASGTGRRRDAVMHGASKQSASHGSLFTDKIGLYKYMAQLLPRARTTDNVSLHCGLRRRHGGKGLRSRCLAGTTRRRRKEQGRVSLWHSISIKETSRGTGVQRTTRRDMAVKALAQRRMPAWEGRYMPDMPTWKKAGVDDVFFCSGDSASQAWMAKTTATLHRVRNGRLHKME